LIVVVVSDASVLINLAWLGKLPLLNTLYGSLLIPPAVWHEIVEKGIGKPGAEEIKAARWLQTRPTQNALLVRALRQDLDAGEAEAIVLALETDAVLLLMDERLGRAKAQHLGLRIIGLIGILVVAKQQGHCDSLKPDLDFLRQVAGFYVSESLYRRVLQDVGES
jgi:predicted nucleic acid-binding protein